jgi:hypothetical protein
MDKKKDAQAPFSLNDLIMDYSPSLIASTGQADIQARQSIQVSSSQTALLSSFKLKAPTGHTSMQSPCPSQTFTSTTMAILTSLYSFSIHFMQEIPKSKCKLQIIYNFF